MELFFIFFSSCIPVIFRDWWKWAVHELMLLHSPPSIVTSIWMLASGVNLKPFGYRGFWCFWHNSTPSVNGMNRFGLSFAFLSLYIAYTLYSLAACWVCRVSSQSKLVIHYQNSVLLYVFLLLLVCLNTFINSLAVSLRLNSSAPNISLLLQVQWLSHPEGSTWDKDRFIRHRHLASLCVSCDRLVSTTMSYATTQVSC